MVPEANGVWHWQSTRETSEESKEEDSPEPISEFGEPCELTSQFRCKFGVYGALLLAVQPEYN